MSHNWSATKQHLHLQSVAEISRHSVLSGDSIWQCETLSGSRHKDRSVSVSRHFLLQALQCPCSVRKRFSRDHCCRGRSKPGCRIVGSHTRWELTTWADFQLCLHRLSMSTGCKSRHSGFLDVRHSNDGLRISGWIGQLSCLTIFSTSLSVAAFLHRADCFGGAWFKSSLLTEMWHPCHIWRETAFQFAEVLALNGETYVVSVNEFSATCNW